MAFIALLRSFPPHHQQVRARFYNSGTRLVASLGSRCTVACIRERQPMQRDFGTAHAAWFRVNSAWQENAFFSRVLVMCVPPCSSTVWTLANWTNESWFLWRWLVRGEAVVGEADWTRWESCRMEETLLALVSWEDVFGVVGWRNASSWELGQAKHRPAVVGFVPVAAAVDENWAKFG